MAGESSSSHDEKAAARPVTGLRKIVWIRQMLQRWQSTAARRSNARAGGDSDSVAARQDNEDAATAGTADDDKKPLLPPAERAYPGLLAVVAEEHGGCGDGERVADGERDPGSEPTTPDAPADVPRGCCAVYVGAERRRFVVPTAYLGMPVFRRLLEKAEEEFGFDYVGGALTIPCETEAFKYILVVMDRHRKGLVDDEGNPTEAGEPSENRESSSDGNIL